MDLLTNHEWDYIRQNTNLEVVPCVKLLYVANSKKYVLYYCQRIKNSKGVTYIDLDRDELFIVKWRDNLSEEIEEVFYAR